MADAMQGAPELVAPPAPAAPTPLTGVPADVAALQSGDLGDAVKAGLVNAIPGGRAIANAAGAVGQLFGTPPPDPSEVPTTGGLVSGPPGNPGTDPAPTAAQQAAPVFQIPPGPDVAALDAQARRIGAVGAQVQRQVADASQNLATAYEDRAAAEQRIAAAQQQGALAQQQGAQAQLDAQAEYKAKLEDMNRRQDEAVKKANDDYQAARDDAQYAGVSRDKRIELQTILNDPAASLQQKARAKLELDKAQQVDPEQFFGGMGKRIGLAIAMGLGSYASAFTGRNDAMQIIQQGIRDNIAAQQQRFAQAGRRVDEASNVYARVRAQFGDEKQAALGMYALGLENAKALVAKYTAMASTDEAKARGQAMQAQLDAELQKSKADLARLAGSTALEGEVAKGNLMAHGAQLEERLQERGMAIAAKGAGKADQVQNLAARGLAMKPGLELSKEEMGQVSKIKGAGDDMIAKIQNLQKLREQAASNPSLLASPKFRAAAESAYYQAQVAYKEGAGLGTWDKGVERLFDNIFGAPPSGLGFLGARYDELAKSARGSRDRKLAAYGVVPLEQTQAPVAGEQPIAAR